jgi:hypothetical protein
VLVPGSTGGALRLPTALRLPRNFPFLAPQLMKRRGWQSQTLLPKGGEEEPSSDPAMQCFHPFPKTRHTVVTYSVAVDKVDYEVRKVERLEDVRWLNVKDEVQEEQ